MTQLLQVYQCQVCGNTVEVVRAKAGTLVCCDQNMTLLEENSTDAAQEKHVPVVEDTDDGVLVTVGSVAHPMTEAHFIEWIEVNADGRSCREFLSPNDAPEAVFHVDAGDVTARALCNLHGLWKA
ncbi:MAG TPA: desulfoferrodoxin [Sumerlaeia bacterium]|nr:desulfoferrodoxin [Sumerlaeia bacterium]